MNKIAFYTGYIDKAASDFAGKPITDDMARNYYDYQQHLKRIGKGHQNIKADNLEYIVDRNRPASWDKPKTPAVKPPQTKPVQPVQPTPKVTK